MLLNVIEEFSNWSSMEVKIVKSCGMWVGAERDLKLSLTLVFREGPKSFGRNKESLRQARASSA
jgi:hypothetical protein